MSPLVVERAVFEDVFVAVGEELSALFGGEKLEKCVFAEDQPGLLMLRASATHVGPEKVAVAGVVIREDAAVEPGEAVGQNGRSSFMGMDLDRKSVV